MSGKKFVASEYDIWLGQTIAVTRMRFGMSQKDLAKKVGVAFQQIHKYETGGNRMTPERLKRIADAFGMTVGQLVDNGVTGRYPHDRAALTLLELFYSKIRTPAKRKMLCQLTQCIAESDSL